MPNTQPTTTSDNHNPFTFVVKDGSYTFTYQAFRKVELGEERKDNLTLITVWNEGELDYWEIDPTAPKHALAELKRYYAEQEPWVDTERPDLLHAYTVQPLSMSYFH